MDVTPTAGEVADQLEIHRLLNRYALAVDRQDWVLLDSCFLPAARVEYESIGALPNGYVDLPR